VETSTRAPSGAETLGRGALALIRTGVGILAAAHVLYLSLLIACDLLRVGSRGFVPQFQGGRVIVSAPACATAIELTAPTGRSFGITATGSA
jgi:hypothetical protein